MARHRGERKMSRDSPRPIRRCQTRENGQTPIPSGPGLRRNPSPWSKPEKAPTEKCRRRKRRKYLVVAEQIGPLPIAFDAQHDLIDLIVAAHEKPGNRAIHAVAEGRQRSADSVQQRPVECRPTETAIGAKINPGPVVGIATRWGFVDQNWCGRRRAGELTTRRELIVQAEFNGTQG